MARERSLWLASGRHRAADRGGTGHRYASLVDGEYGQGPDAVRTAADGAACATRALIAARSWLHR
ncbi:MAG TPA: hypothetical protein VEH05_01275 [Streptosporangiaceae bacterium]|nr:hypothetical protein [Streptosporangiaceae bacterium]